MIPGPVVTGVGSLPHTDPADAAVFVRETTTLPYVPQLPNRHSEERMLVQWGDGLCGCGAAAGSIGLGYGAPEGPRLEAFRGAATLLESLEPGTPAVKTQATGPVTLALGLLSAGHPGPGLLECVVGGILERVELHLSTIRSRLPETEIVLVFDEPGLSGLLVPGFPVSPEDARRMLQEVLAACPIEAGLHCCADTDWSVVASARPALISLDVNSAGAAFDSHAEALAELTWQGTRFMWGVVPTQADPCPSDLAARLQRVVGRLVMAGAQLDGLVDGAMFSPACGLAGLSESQAETVARAVVHLAEDVVTHG